jgi:polyferredoxin
MAVNAHAPRLDPVTTEVETALFEVRKKIYPRAVQGRFASFRVALVAFTQLLYYGLPWLAWNGRQAVLFDLGARKFYIFGWVLWPQDFIYLTMLLVLAALSLFLFTAIAGRLFCGYACPQTVYTEIFLWIERLIEGDRQQRMRLDKGAAGARKVALKGAKHAAWIAFAAWTGFTFVGYFTPIHVLSAEVATFSVARGKASGSRSMRWRRMATPAGCASRCASTCARMRGSRASCSTPIRW